MIGRMDAARCVCHSAAVACKLRRLWNPKSARWSTCPVMQRGAVPKLSSSTSPCETACGGVLEWGADWCLLRRMDAGPFRITRKQYSAAFRQGVHSHAAGTIDFNLAGGGCGTYAGKSVESHAGAVEFFAPGRPHSFRAGPVGIRTMHVSFGTDVLDSGGRDEERPEEHIDQARAAGLATRLLRELCDPDRSSPLAAEALAYQLMAATTLWIGKPERGVRWLSWVQDQLHAAEDVTLNELAAQAGVHRAHLARSFSAQYGVSVGEYQRRLRLARAARRIASGDASLTRVSHESGFSDQAHLTRWFTRVLGVTPGTYARAMKSERVALRAWLRA